MEDLTKRDVKIAYHKNLQGYLWENGYESGAYSTPLFDDVVPQLLLWKQEGKEVAIYSSGSVFAQKLLMQHVRDAAGKDGKVSQCHDCIINTPTDALFDDSKYKTCQAPSLHGSIPQIPA